ncbi:MAG: hypothetical protein KA275_02155 [Chitinophagaceae bacterium]|nr:hypothetical protein [Chitinophagaceae bacterium]
MRPLFFLSLIILISFLSCKKQPGFGGRATISGKVYAIDYNKNWIKISEGYMNDCKVFISIDGETGVLDDVRTDVNGNFKIENLRKGTYNVWVNTRCDTCVNDQKPLIKNIVVEGNKDEINVEEFKIDL